MTLVTVEEIAAFRETGARFVPASIPFPEMVLVDVTSRCNLSCVHCPSSQLYEEEGFVGDIDPALYRKIVDEVAEFPDTTFRPFDGGEPLLRRDIAEMIRYAKDKGIRKVAITTNGTLLIPRVRQQLIEAGLDAIEISIDAVTPETYKAVRQSTLHARVVANTLGYIEEVKARHPERPVVVSFVAQQTNEHERADFVAFWSGKADGVYVREYHQHNNLMSPLLRLTKPTQPLHRHPCPFIYERLIVHHTGEVKFCEFDWQSQHPVGDVRTQTLAEIWNGPAMTALRAQHAAGTFDHPYCHSCSDWREVKWPGL